MKNNLFIGYGNPDRGDDGAAYILLITLLENYGKSDYDLFTSEITSLTAGTDILYNFQLLPEYAELIGEYDRVLFIDAHTGEIEEDIRFVSVDPVPQHSPFTHHFSPSSCLALVSSITGKKTEGWLLSIRGFKFGFERELSSKTQALVDKAIVIIQENFL